MRFVPVEMTFCTEKSRFTKKSGSDITHVSLLKFIVLPIVLVNADEDESFNNPIYIKAHVNETIDKLLVVSLITVYLLVNSYDCFH